MSFKSFVRFSEVSFCLPLNVRATGHFRQCLLPTAPAFPFFFFFFFFFPVSSAGSVSSLGKWESPFGKICFCAAADCSSCVCSSAMMWPREGLWVKRTSRAAGSLCVQLDGPFTRQKVQSTEHILIPHGVYAYNKIINQGRFDFGIGGDITGDNRHLIKMFNLNYGLGQFSSRWILPGIMSLRLNSTPLKIITSDVWLWKLFCFWIVWLL